MTRRLPARQRGMALVVGLILLALMTVMAITGFNIGRTSLDIVGNMQGRQEVIAADNNAIQEAISCGIPVVATAVGGNPEVVSEKNGILLNSNPKPQEIAAALLKIWDDPQQVAKMKQESRQVWQRNYDAEVNFRLFADRLRTMGAR